MYCLSLVKAQIILKLSEESIASLFKRVLNLLCSCKAQLDDNLINTPSSNVSLASKNLKTSQNLVMDWGMDFKRLAFGAGGVNMQEKIHTLSSDIKDLAEIWKPIFVVLLIYLCGSLISSQKSCTDFSAHRSWKKFPYSLDRYFSSWQGDDIDHSCPRGPQMVT